MTDKIKPEFNNQAAHEPNDAFAPAENNRSTPAKENIGQAEEKDTTKQTGTVHQPPKSEKEKASQEFKSFEEQFIKFFEDFQKWCDKTNKDFANWLDRTGPKLDKTLQKHGKALSKLMVKTALVLAALTAQVKKETHEPELGDTKVKTTWTASTLGLPGLAIDSEDGKIIDVRMPLAETANELVRDELPNIDKVHEPEPIKNGAWKTTRELLRDNSAQKPETSLYEAEETKDITALQIAVATPETSEHKTEGTKDISSLQTQALKHLKNSKPR